jgi:hypothetical protein
MAEAVQVAQAFLPVPHGLERPCPRVELFTLQGHFSEPPYYELCMDWAAAGVDDGQALAERLDAALRRLNVEYHSKRTTGRLGPIRFRALPAGTLTGRELSCIAARHGRSEQYKHQYLLTETIVD